MRNDVNAAKDDADKLIEGGVDGCAPDDIKPTARFLAEKFALYRYNLYKEKYIRNGNDE